MGDIGSMFTGIGSGIGSMFSSGVDAVGGMFSSGAEASNVMGTVPEGAISVGDGMKTASEGMSFGDTAMALAPATLMFGGATANFAEGQINTSQQIQNAKAMEEQSRLNAQAIQQASEQQAKYAQQVGDANAMRERKRETAIMAEIRAKKGASGIVDSTGSSLMAELENARNRAVNYMERTNQARYQSDTIKYQGQMQAFQQNLNADYYKSQQSQLQSMRWFGGINYLLGGAGAVTQGVFNYKTASKRKNSPYFDNDYNNF